MACYMRFCHMIYFSCFKFHGILNQNFETLCFNAHERAYILKRVVVINSKNAEINVWYFATVAFCTGIEGIDVEMAFLGLYEDKMYIWLAYII